MSKLHLQHHQTLILALYDFCKASLPFISDQASETDQEFINKLEQLSKSTQLTDDFIQTGQHLISQIIGSYSHITPNVSRDLLWFFAGDCLHFMSDEEISRYQQVDELFFEAQDQGKDLNYSQAKATIFQLH